MHTVLGFGAASETFVVDRVLELDRLGWEAWVGAKWIVDEALFEFPSPERVLAPRPRDELLRRLGPWGRRREWWWLERPIAKVKPTLIHAHFGWTGREVLGAAEHYGIPLAVGFHDYDATVYPRYGFDTHDEAAERTMPEGSTTTSSGGPVASSPPPTSLPRSCATSGATARSMSFPRGSAWRASRSAGRAEDARPGELRLLFVGRLVPYKGLDVLLRALATLTDGGSVAATLTVIGDGPARAEHEELTAGLGISGLVDFRGRQPRSVVLEAFNEADVLVLAQSNHSGGTGRGPRQRGQGGARGLKVAVSDNGGIPEAVPPERHGELTPEGDATALAKRLEAIDLERGDWPSRARDGRRWVEETFDWRQLALGLDEGYRRIAPASS